MNIGKLNSRIDIWQQVEFENELGEKDYKPVKSKTIWASIIPQTGKLQQAQADTILTNTTHKMIVRYNSGKDIKENDYIVFRGKRFDIKFILNPYFKDETLEIFTEQVI